MCRMARAEATTAPPPTTTTTTTVNTNQTAEHKLHNTHYYLFLLFTVIINVRVSAISPVLSVSPVLSILCKINLASMPQLSHLAASPMFQIWNWRPKLRNLKTVWSSLKVPQTDIHPFFGGWRTCHQAYYQNQANCVQLPGIARRSGVYLQTVVRIVRLVLVLQVTASCRLRILLK